MTRVAAIAATAGLVLVLLAPCSRAGENVERSEWHQRGKPLSLTIYRPAGADFKGTIIMAGGDVGWVGLAVTMAQRLVGEGYVVVGINVRQYLSAFTLGASPSKVIVAENSSSLLAA